MITGLIIGDRQSYSLDYMFLKTLSTQGKLYCIHPKRCTVRVQVRKKYARGCAGKNPFNQTPHMVFIVEKIHGHPELGCFQLFCLLLSHVQLAT